MLENDNNKQICWTAFALHARGQKPIDKRRQLSTDLGEDSKLWSDKKREIVIP